MAELATSLRGQTAPLQPPTRFHERLWAEELSIQGGESTYRLASALSEARVDLNPHQVEAAAFALESLPRGGCLLADEVGLGKTIEAGIVVAQLLAEGKPRVLILCPATLRAQWQSELWEKFEVEAAMVDGRAAKGAGNPFDRSCPVIASHPFAASRAESLSQIPWDLVVIDEAHRLRNAYKSSHKTGQALKTALKDRPKLLLTATPLQNDLLELFGLLSFLDEQILGPEHAFRSRYQVDSDVGALAENATTDLKGRLSSAVHRTLRRQVREYVRYTNRRSIVEDFAPSAEEQDLYEKVSEYLRRSEAAAIEPGKKTLLTLVYRKLLASSTYAIAPTLRKLAEGLKQRLALAQRGREADSFFEPEELRQYSEEAEEWKDEAGAPPSLKALRDEIWELEQYAEQAGRISVNAKGEALRRALDRTFTVARAHQWPEKAVVFTESKRTQEYLFALLSEHGYRGKIALLSGDAGTPEERRALVESFRDHHQILLSTEAGAEGLNLQFCNLVVNYDLPWNPQRIEQRIGRCHRYGQKRDVLVINFLNRQNAADARLYELLEKKLNLFDGVFGASDEILGALESGLDFERRVLDIYQSCRTVEEIDQAFGKLRAELESRIDQRMTETRSLLIERFDGEVRRRLRLAGQQAEEAVALRKQKALALTHSVLGAGRVDHEKVKAAAQRVRERPQESVHYLSLDAGSLPTKLANLAGREGWWFVYRVQMTGLKSEEKLAHLILLEEDGAFRPLPLEDGDLLSKVPAQNERHRKPKGTSVSAFHEQALTAAREQLIRGAEIKNSWELDVAKDRADRFTEDGLLKHRQEVTKACAEWETARRALVNTMDPAERARARVLAERLEREHRKKLAALRTAEDRLYAQKDNALAQLAQKAKVSDRRNLVVSAYFWID